MKRLESVVSDKEVPEEVRRGGPTTARSGGMVGVNARTQLKREAVTMSYIQFKSFCWGFVIG